MRLKREAKAKSGFYVEPEAKLVFVVSSGAVVQQCHSPRVWCGRLCRVQRFYFGGAGSVASTAAGAKQCRGGAVQQRRQQQQTKSGGNGAGAAPLRGGCGCVGGRGLAAQPGGCGGVRGH